MCKLSNHVSPTQRTLNLLCFNVEGLNSTSEDPLFSELVTKHDICLLTETWKGDDSKIDLTGFWDFHQIRPKHRKAFRHSGGISVLVKDELRPGIKVVHNTEGFVWLKLDKNFFSFLNDVFLCAAYIPPQYTTKNINLNTDYFQSLYEACLKFSTLGNIIIAGDLNGRVGQDFGEDCIDIRDIDDMLPDESIPSSGGLPRSSCDKVLNGYGRKIIEFCQGFNLNIANGRAPGDRLGNFTCFNNRGASTVDYVIADKSFLANIKKLLVLPPEFLSVHSPISFTIGCDIKCENSVTKLLPSPPKFIWDENQSELFFNHLNHPTIIGQLDRIRSYIRGEPGLDPREIDSLLKEVSEILYNTATQCFKIKKRRATKLAKPKSKPWFNSECADSKKRLQNLAKLIVKHPRDPFIVGKYNLVKKQYKNLIKS